MKREKDKVYCKDCIYLSDYTFCNYYEENPYTGEIIEHALDKHRNQAGECPRYERKWWKFWVEKEEIK